MSKATKIILACVAGFLLLCCGGGALLVMGGFNAYKGLGAETVQLGDDAVPAICKTWDVDALLKLSGPDLQKTPKIELDSIFSAWKSEYGSYQSGTGSMTSFNSSSATGTGRSTTATYQNDAAFEKGQALITIVYKKVEPGDWKISAFNVVKR